MEYFGKEASSKNKELVLNKKVRLEKDISDTDRYGRLLRYVYTEDGVFVNDYLVRHGYAKVYTYPPDVKYSDLFLEAQVEARENNRGLWGEGASLEYGNIASEHLWYTSSHPSSKYYYCDTDSAWKGLSNRHLKSFSSQEELLRAYPSRILHTPCQ